MLFRSLRPSSKWGFPFWPSGLTVRRSRPPTASAELRALVLPIIPLQSPCQFQPPSPSQAPMQRGFGRVAGFACKGCASFKPFWSLALAQQALAAIVSVVLGAAIRALFHPSGLTRQSSRPAYGGRLTLAVSYKGGFMTKCKYCGSSSFGSGCPHSPTKKHEHSGDEKKCEYCNSSSYGSGCPHSPTKKHRHGSGANKCRWCGSSSVGSGCPHSPTGKHEK